LEQQVNILEPWHLVSLDSVSKRTQMGKAIVLGLRHGWEVQVARTVSEIPEHEQKNGEMKPAKIEEHFWVGGARPNMKKPERAFRINKMYMKIQDRSMSQNCNFDELQQFIIEY
jgi:hypothetical protein